MAVPVSAFSQFTTRAAAATLTTAWQHGASGGTVAVNSTYQNRPGDTTYPHTADLFAEKFARTPARPSPPSSSRPAPRRRPGPRLCTFSM
jgi:hypothetical protein